MGVAGFKPGRKGIRERSDRPGHVGREGIAFGSSANIGWPAPMEIYFGTVLIEPNRWRSEAPLLRASEWVERAMEAGFDGVELWERHFLEADPAEREAILARGRAIRVLSSYASFAAGDPSSRAASLAAAGALGEGLRGVKMNVGRPPLDLEAEVAEAGRFGAALPAGLGLWCECHSGSALEEPAAAGAALARWGDRAGVILHPIGMDPGTMTRWFEAAQGRVPHLHLQGRDATGRWVCLDERADTVRDAFGKLRALGFSGSATVEFTAGVAKPGEDPVALFAAAVRDLHFLRAEGF